DLPEKINSSEELIRYSCRHINLEEIKMEEEQGNLIKEIYRPDPNINIRGQIFQKSWEAIKNHPILGIGFGAISPILGQDGRGTSLNSSNIFLEVWLGSGLIGLIAFIFIWLNAIVVFVKRFWSGNNEEEKAFTLFILLGIFAFLIPNLFNAGIFLMILWFFWGIVPLKFKD
ncbi:O-antigen ligase family protein, partial [Patescibacteria group bacterium]|nr:O-antigen ligase family protein [Patescibacteria group bacterium]